MKKNPQYPILFTLILSLPVSQATVTLMANDTFSAPSGTSPGNLAITGDLSIYKGLDVGTTTIGALPSSAISIDWYNTASLPRTASFDLTDANAAFQWRDNLAAGASVRNKMTLNAQNILSLYNITGAAANISLNGNTGTINLAGSGSGIFANGTPVFSLDSAGKVNFSNSGTFQNTSPTPSTSPTTGALTLAGGLGVAGSINTSADCYFNGIRVGKGAGSANLYSLVVGDSALARNQTGYYNTAIGLGALYNNLTGSNNTALGIGAGSNRGTTGLADANKSVFIGMYSRGANAVNNNTNSIVIGYDTDGEGSNTTVIGNTSTTKTHLFGETVLDRLKVSGGSHLGATTQILLNLPVGVTGSYFGPQKTGSNFYSHDFLFTKTGNETTGDFTVPLGIFNNMGGEITIDISTPSGDPDSGSAHFVLSGKRFTSHSDLLIASEYKAFGGTSDLELYGRSDHGYTILFIKFDAKNYSPGQVYEHMMQVKVSGLASGAEPQNRDYPFSFVSPIAKIDSTTRPNGGITTRSITAAELKLDGKITISQPQGDISMGIYQ